MKQGSLKLTSAHRVVIVSLLVFFAITLSLPLNGSQEPGSLWDFQEAIWTGNVQAAQKIISEHPDSVRNFRFGPNPPVVEAAQHGRREILQVLMTNNVDINAHGVWGKTALHFAANNGDAKAVEILLKNRADVNALDENGFAPIVQSIKSVEVLKLLLAYGADINAHGGQNTLYSQAIENPQSVGAGVIDFILTNGVDVTVSGGGKVSLR